VPAQDRPTRFLVAGEALVDVVVPSTGTPERTPGGSPLNVAVGLARLGVPTTLATQLGDDPLGRLVIEHLERSGVDLDEQSVRPGSATSTATATLDEHGAASYDFDVQWTDEPRSLPAGITALHVGSLGTVVRPGRDRVVALAAEAAAAGLLVSFDPNARPAVTPDAERAWADAEEVAGLAGVVKVSDEDLAFLRPGEPPEQVARGLLEGPTRLVVVTFGGDKAVAVSREATAEVAALQSRVVDTVGAGDSFRPAPPAVVAERGVDRLDGRRLTGSLAAAHEAAAVTVSRRGADPPWREELSPDWPRVT